MHSEADWGAAAQKFQQTLSESWGKALQSFGQIGLPDPEHGQGVTLSPLSFSGDKLQLLQQSYVKEATDLWNNGLQLEPAGDKRFASEAWGANPVAAFSACVARR